MCHLYKMPQQKKTKALTPKKTKCGLPSLVTVRKQVKLGLVEVGQDGSKFFDNEGKMFYVSKQADGKLKWIKMDD